MSHQTVIKKILFLVSPTSENIAQFQIQGNLEDPDVRDWVQVFPYFGMHEIYRQNAGSPIALMDGMMMSETSFLWYLTNVVIETERQKQYYCEIRSDNGDRLILRQGMDAKEIAKLTGWDIEMIRTYYRNCFVVKVD
jgi:hypothetical protein